MQNLRHQRWVKATHFIITLSFLALTVSGFVILMSHPRLYWGQAGNDLTPALFELPISRNYQHHGFTKPIPFTHLGGTVVSAARTYDIFNQNGWGRSSHFLAAWFLVITGLLYFITGWFSGHFRRNLLPGAKTFSFRLALTDFRSHFRKQPPAAGKGPQYGLLQRVTYLVVIFFLFPLVILTGFTMSPAITASYPFLIKMFFGEESARTIHFFAASALLLFLLVHLVMIIRTGFKQNILAITFGKPA
ncbi:cytochrome b/b6 domain-containing protein [Mucilaginibacter sp.]|uniref:cytochrome b/b6 domain-containing protein n=1 Tax=Mucilaginibacter sp. TaxID=1882438 RepID=UPI00283E07DA|nr:cytochrome b/b6 domain-containing protein [Mucilaginibacter sp.]MDR3697682.1 cytochrome b/b6 domain-containing protein [Mucilaginibacter sp.]